METPSYYESSTHRQVFDFIEDYGLNFNLGNVAKYIARCGKKGTSRDAIADLKKAIAYLEREVFCREREAKEKADLEAFARREQG